MKHTPGPWRVNATPQSSNQNWVVLDSAPGHHKRVCAVYSSNDEADARLIAEAPAMLDLLKLAADDSLFAWERAALVDQISAVIARIEGKP